MPIIDYTEDSIKKLRNKLNEFVAYYREYDICIISESFDIDDLIDAIETEMKRMLKDKFDALKANTEVASLNQGLQERFEDFSQFAIKTQKEYIGEIQMLRDALQEYANSCNWTIDKHGCRKIWVKNNTGTTLAREIISKSD